jgi:hypothetical protein
MQIFHLLKRKIPSAYINNYVQKKNFQPSELIRQLCVKPINQHYVNMHKKPRCAVFATKWEDKPWSTQSNKKRQADIKKKLIRGKGTGETKDFIIIFMDQAMLSVFRPAEEYVSPSILTVGALFFVVLVGCMIKLDGLINQIKRWQNLCISVY